MRWRAWTVMAAVCLATACAGGDDGVDDGVDLPEATTATTPPETADPAPTTPSTSVAPDTTAAPTTAASTTTTVPPPPPTGVRFAPTGPEEMVFDWTTDRCEDLGIPDIATRVVRNADGLIQLYIGNITTYRMVGADFDSLTIDCDDPVMTSGFDPDPAQFDDNEWIATTYTDDGETVYGIVHNEYLGADHADARPGRCPSGDFFNCIDVSLTLAVSTDGGATFEHAAEPPGHLIATLPYEFDDAGLASGLWQTSNLVERDDGYWYMLVNIATYPDTGIDLGGGAVGLNWICALRTEDLADPASWRYWDGESFDGVFVNPYAQDVSEREVCAPVDFPSLSGEMSESIIWVESIGKYVIVGGTYEPGTDQQNWGTYFATSDDLLNWSPRKLLKSDPIPRTVEEQATMTFVAYPTLVDHDSDSRNFDTSDGDMYLYQTRFNFGGQSLDRDLVRTPVRIEEFVIEPPAWNFDTDGDLEGWTPELDLTDVVVADGVLSMRSTNDDPILTISGIEIPAQYGTITITMSSDGGRDDAAQIFFVTDDDDQITTSKLGEVTTRSDGEMRTYVFDMSTVDEWDGTIVGLRFDPVTSADTPVVVDSIVVS